MALITRSTRSSDTAALIFTLGRKSTTYSRAAVQLGVAFGDQL
jgi:hypothetical protein